MRTDILSNSDHVIVCASRRTSEPLIPFVLEIGEVLVQSVWLMRAGDTLFLIIDWLAD